MIVLARDSLIASAASIDHAPGLLLEGDWPAREGRFSLDAAIDARHAGIDADAVELAERVGEAVPLAWINALALRYYFVRLLRPIAFFQDTPAGRSIDQVQLHVARERDEDYTGIVAQLCQQRGAPWDIHWHEGPCPASPAPPANGAVRRLASLLNARQTWPRTAKQRVLLCGNPDHLGPVCGELLARGCDVAWLFDRLAFGPWARWQLRGVRQFTCDSSLGRYNAFREQWCGPLVCRGIDLATPMNAWLRALGSQKGCRQTQIFEQVHQHVADWRPDALVLDEDATPLARTAVMAARDQGATTLVVQHGVPRVRFGFQPLAADLFLAWGQSSVEQLVEWGVPRERTLITGAPRMPAATPRKLYRHPKTVLLLATTAPDDGRPDAVEYHLTTHSHAEMLRMALAAVAGVPQARLILKLHPRCRDVGLFQRLAAEFPSLKCRIVCGGTVQPLCREADVALDCASSAGLEAAHTGLPVIELLPRGGQKLAAPDAWGLFGWAATFEELCTLLDRALNSGHALRGSPFARHSQTAAQAVVDAILHEHPAVAEIV